MKAAAALAAVAWLCAGCNLQPLPAPLPSEVVVEDGLRVWLADADLPALAAAARAAAGSEVPLVTAPWAVPLSGGALIGAVNANLRIESAEASWTSEEELRFAFRYEAGSVPLALGYPGGAACGLSLQWPLTEAQVALRFGLEAGLVPQATLASTPSWPTTPPPLVDPQGCTEGLSTQSLFAIRQQLWGEVRTAAVARASVGAATAAQAVVAGPWPFGARVGPAEQASDWEVRPLPRQPGSSTGFLGGPPDQRFARLALGATASRHACAPDVPPPALPAVWPPYPAPTPGPVSVARRGVAVHGASLAHIGWVATRAGMLCRTARGWGEQLGSDWAGAIAPALTPWIDGSPLSVRLWPGATPAVEVVDAVGGVELSWRLDDTTLEIAAPVAGDEVIVLVIRGRLRLRTRVTPTAGGMRLESTATVLESAQVTSPLFGDTLPAGSPGDVRALVSAAVAGIIGDLPVLPLSSLLPSGTALTGTSRGGNALWLWLDSSSL